MSKRRPKSPIRVACRPHPFTTYHAKRGLPPPTPRQVCKWVCRDGAEIRAAEFIGRGTYRGWTAILHPSTKERGRWQVSLFAKDGAFGDSIRDTCTEALDAREVTPRSWKLKAVE
jgi:hypothetical protein